LGGWLSRGAVYTFDNPPAAKKLTVSIRLAYRFGAEVLVIEVGVKGFGQADVVGLTKT